ncbi:hypothetical protein [Adhaeribacter aquaticus]|uniref:hypothetical protein n=1 Tax=Adhaeribacter aquaticus TaxID=299567 RepID=UPI0006873617|nr:hypothetical protein [Adhaeribacter aquaticus]
MKLFIFLLVYLLGECVAFFVFKLIRKRFERDAQKSESTRKLDTSNAIIKGLLERFFIYLCLVNELPHALTVLGALKIGTRLDADKQHAISNDYFLIGNISSILLAITYYLVWNKWQTDLNELFFAF